MTETLPTKNTNPEQLAELMVGRKVLLRVNKNQAKPGKSILKCTNLNYSDAQGVNRLKNISFDLKEGEILGIAGVAGNGQSELLEVLSGIKSTNGTIKLKGETIPLFGKMSNAYNRRNGTFCWRG